MINQLEADMDILVNRIAASQGFLGRRAVLGQADKVKDIARHILTPIYQDAEKWREHCRVGGQNK